MHLVTRKGFSEKLSRIQQYFPPAEVESLKMDTKRIQDYYRINRIFYSLFLPSKDYIYVGISRDGRFKHDDLLEAARTVARYIVQSQAHTVLELATGRGANSGYLAREFSDTQFYGIDISESQLTYARKRSKTFPNYLPEFGDYHDLRRFEDGMFDVVFVVEALCYSTEKERVLNEVRRVLKPGGYFIIFDGYLSKDRSSIRSDERLACLYTERGMGLKEFEDYASFARKAQGSGFMKEYEEDVSHFTLPMFELLERVAYKFFDHPLFARLMKTLLPKIFLYNAMSGYLLATVVKAGLFCYMITILKKESHDSKN